MEFKQIKNLPETGKGFLYMCHPSIGYGVVRYTGYRLDDE